MLYTYPSNKLENLVFALDTLLKSIERPVLASDTILVQHPGMQHWLSMELAKHSSQQICMNAQFPLPVRYFWDLIRLILGPGIVPDRSVYTREILAWRIYRLLDDSALKAHALTGEPTSYWQDQPEALKTRRRFQLAEQLADVYEQYLMFRPEWIEQWEQQPAQHWQAYIWQRLVEQDPNHPLRLMRLAAEKIRKPVLPLPSHFFLFGINALAPIWLDFLTALSEQTETDIHLLYLNPSAEHWDSLPSEKQQIKQLIKAQAQPRADWLQDNDEGFWTCEASNPILTSLGQQGQAFVKMLSTRAHYDAQVFSAVASTTRLGRLQNDLLQGVDGRQSPSTIPADSSISVTSAHSAFREVQGLHDWLLHQFNNDASLTPKDVLVMCPNVEDYAPFVQAIFARSFADMPDDVPPLPCSIADRNLKDADPTVAAFLELLTLPDARFEVSQILSWLRVPAIAHKFSLTSSDLQKITHWLTQANVHWGLHAPHKAQWLDVEPTAHFTWQQGLDRLLLGFAYADEDSFVNGHALMHQVEGADALLLGKLTFIIEQLQSARSELTRARTPSDWQGYLIDQLKTAMLSTDSSFERSHQSILKAVNDFTEFANKAELTEVDLPLSVIRHVLENAFASPEQTGSQFMTGQITVCSMVPMRSIPFRVIAILGLNDGQFPRTRPPLGFDLMAQDKPRLGDRSRRGDDRYLFLEAILSARDALYLSYQGFDIRKNEKRPPSLVLEELFSYLQAAYGFDKTTDIRTLPLQPFSDKNYQGSYPSFDTRWAQVTKQKTPSAPPTLAPLAELKKDWHVSEWVAFFHHPAKYFAQQRLGLFLDNAFQESPQDSEPFTLSHLDRYQIQQDTVNLWLNNQSIDDLVARKTAASEFPLTHMTEQMISQWQQQAHEFADYLKQLGAQQINQQHVALKFEDFTLTADLPITSNGDVLTWRLANMKGRDIIQLWLLHLIANCQQPTQSKGIFRGKDETLDIVQISPVSNAREVILNFHKTLCFGLSEPLYLNADLMLPMLQDQYNEKTFTLAWDDAFWQRGLRYDPYIAYFWQHMPNFQMTTEQLTLLHDSLVQHVSIEKNVEPHHD